MKRRLFALATLVALTGCDSDRWIVHEFETRAGLVIRVPVFREASESPSPADGLDGSDAAELMAAEFDQMSASPLVGAPETVTVGSAIDR